MSDDVCERCGRPCQAGSPGNAEARPLRRAAKGMCANCAITAFLLAVEPVADAIERQGPSVLMAPLFQEQMALLMQVGNSDAAPGEIDWETVARNWALPIPRRRKRGE